MSFESFLLAVFDSYLNPIEISFVRKRCEKKIKKNLALSCIFFYRKI